MKKKLMMVAVLLGALSLGACVDDNESASVTDLRGAKAEQLRALASMYEAQGRADEIRANAEAAYNEAAAAYQQALADEKAFYTQKAKDEYERNLEKAELDAQTALIQAQIDLQNKEEELLGMLDTKLKALYATYKTESNALTEAQRNLANAKNQLTRVNEELISGSEANRIAIENLEKQIAVQEATIKAYEAYEGEDLADLENELLQLTSEYNNANAVEGQKLQSYRDAKAAYDKLIEQFNDPSSAEDLTLKTLEAVATLDGMSVSVLYDKETLLEDPNLEVYSYYLGEEAIAQKRNQLEKELKQLNDDLGVSTSGSETGLYLDLKTAQTNLSAAITAKDQDLMDQYEEEVGKYNDQIRAKKAEIEEKSQDLKDFEAAVKSFSGDDYKAYTDAIEALKKNETVLAVGTTYAEYETAQKATQEIGTEMQVVNNLKNYAVDAKEEISKANAEIADLKEQIAATSDAELEYWVLYWEAEVEKYTLDVEVCTERVAMAKANLDEALAEEDGNTETPNTPAEDETPSEEQPAA